MIDYSTDPDEGINLVVADFASWAIGHLPWRTPGETSPEYVARVAPFYPDHTAEEVAQWYEHASELPA